LGKKEEEGEKDGKGTCEENAQESEHYKKEKIEKIKKREER
jgi:hypothetical protein